MPSVKAVAQDARDRDITVAGRSRPTRPTRPTSPASSPATGVYRDGTPRRAPSAATSRRSPTGPRGRDVRLQASPRSTRRATSPRRRPQSAGEIVANDPPVGGPQHHRLPGPRHRRGHRLHARPTAGPGRRSCARSTARGRSSAPRGRHAGRHRPRRDQPRRPRTAGRRTPRTSVPVTSPASSRPRARRPTRPSCRTSRVQRPAQTAAGHGGRQGHRARPPSACRSTPAASSTASSRNGANFTRNGRNAILTPADGTLPVDADGSFTATYTGLSAADVTRALNGETIDHVARPRRARRQRADDHGELPGHRRRPRCRHVCTAPLEPNVAAGGADPGHPRRRSPTPRPAPRAPPAR